MGNSNSGRYGGKLKCEQCLAIDVRSMARKGLLKPDSAFKWQWSNGNEIGCHIHPNAIDLRYATNARPMQTYTIELSATPCNYGGVRSWFVCPYCQHRRAKLYLKQSRFACRCCQRLRYQSQALDPLARNQWAYSKLQTRLINGETRPKGMHWRTFEGLYERMERIDAGIYASFELSIYRLMKRYSGKR